MENDFISVFWAWNSDLNLDKLKEQLVDLKSKGVNNVFVHARAGLKTEYMGREWMDAFKYCCKVAKDIDSKIWIYDENGWPSGFGGGIVYETDPSFKERYLSNLCDTYDNIIKENRKIIKIFDDSYNELKEEELDPDKKYNFVCLMTNDYYVDITNSKAVKCFLDTTHEIYKKEVGEYFGDVIPGVFTDEPHVSPDGFQYAPHIVSEYEKRYKEDFSVAIKYLFFNTGDYRKYRLRYRDLLSDLILNNYTKQYNAWCKNNGLILTGHYTCEEGLVDQIPTSGKLTGLYDNMGLIGVDALGNRLVPLPTFRRTMSSSYQNGKGEVLVETFAGTGYDSTFNELLRIWMYEAMNGVTHPCLSISMSSLEGNRKRDYPNFFSNQMPWWTDAKILFDEMKFIRNQIKYERHQDILLVEPISSIELSDRNDSLAITSSFRVLNESLYYSQLDFDYGDEKKVETALIDDGKIKIGECSYSKIILPFQKNITSGVLSKLKEFSKKGGKVYVVTPLPEYLDGERKEIVFDFEYTPIMNRKSYIRKLAEVGGWLSTHIEEKYTRKLHDSLSTCYRYEGNTEYLSVLNQDRCTRKQGRIVSSGQKKAYRVKRDSRIEIAGVYNKYENRSEFEFELKEMEYAFFEIVEGCPLQNTYSTMDTLHVKPFKISTNLNSLVIDKTSISINGSEYSDRGYIIDKTKELYSRINGKGDSVVKAKYEFNISDMPNELFAIGEYMDSKVFINGVEIDERLDSFYDDAKKINIIRYVREGSNEIVLEKRIESFYDPILGEDVYQSIGNIFSFPFYLESIILDGDFKVRAKGLASLTNYIISDDDFTIIKSDDLIVHDMTSSGYPFYRGVVESEYEITYDGSERCLLEIENTFATSNVISINGKERFLDSGFELDITDLLKPGINKIKLTLRNGLRNTFGPFHHKYGKHYYTGPSVFEGYAEWQDFVIYPELKGSTYMDEYSFTHLYVPDITIKKG